MENILRIRILDCIFAGLALIVFAPFFIGLYLLLLFETRYPVFRQMRLGKDEALFPIYKFRTMKIGTQDLATHLAPTEAVTGIGKFLRRSKIDELPQLWCVLIGDMSLVGPRPNLPSQIDLITARRRLGIYKVRPGITGLSQLKSIDMSTPTKLAEYDAKMISTMSLRTYFKYIFETIFGNGFGDHIKDLNK
jgi:lipopolysaccharide/colanic/teichoic acid biosynthesis glycosyltransferase